MGGIFYSTPFNEELRGLPGLFRKKTRDGKIHPYCKLMILECHVSDEFLYYHYNMNEEIDCDFWSGWGCAYRCVQMIVSFYKVHFKDEEINIPKIREIQQALASIEYIPSSHVGSREWIEPHHSAVYVQNFLHFQTREIIYYKFKDIAMETRQQEVEESESQRIGQKGFDIIMSLDQNAIDLAEFLIDHFKNVKSPVMVDNSIQAFIIAGIRIMENPIKSNEEEEEEEIEGEKDDIEEEDHKKKRIISYQILIFDPHCRNAYSSEEYKENRNDMKSYGKGIKWKNLKKFFLDVTYKRWMIFLPQKTVITY